MNPCRNASSLRIMERFLEQRYTIKFCVKFDKTGKDDMIFKRSTVMLLWVDGLFLSLTSCFEKVGKEWMTTYTLEDTFRSARATKSCHDRDLALQTFSVSKKNIDAQGEASWIVSGASTSRDEPKIGHGRHTKETNTKKKRAITHIEEREIFQSPRYLYEAATGNLGIRVISIVGDNDWWKDIVREILM
ncbi:hypothetical protein TNCV_1690121 [Trichonephila clavipes]|nr:hypothetical protein TNCV_1690121 [Trichonephila clavipes]